MLPKLLSRVFVFHSATAVFYSPSDLSGVGGMRKEILRATPSWRKGFARYDCVFVETEDLEKEAGFKGLHVARLKLLFSFVYREIRYDCALIHWFERTAEVEDELTGMWTVEPENDEDDAPHFSVVHIDTILRAAHLIPVYDGTVIDKYHRHETTLDNFNKFFVNKFADHHANEIAF